MAGEAPGPELRGSDGHAGPPAAEGLPPVPGERLKLTRSLSNKLLFLTVLFVMLAEVLIFVPSIANFRLVWLSEKLDTAAAASLVIDGLEGVTLPQTVQEDLLMATGTMAIALRENEESRLIAATEMPGEIDATYELGEVSALGAIRDAFATMVSGGDNLIRVLGPVGETAMGGDSGMRVEIVMSDRALYLAMLTYGRNVFLLSLLISFITAGLVFLAINTLLIVPIRRMTESMMAFSADPENPANVIRPDPRQDEIGVAEQHLSGMQSQLQRTLREQHHLANLGLAVSKINHDMRNLLSSAQLISDRLSTLDDPVVKRFAPKLLRAIDRAVGYSNAVLSYGRAQEAEPTRRWLRLHALVADVGETLGLDAESDIEFVNAVPETLEIEADSEQIFRVILNLCRNAAQALSGDDEIALVKRITVEAHREGGVVTIAVDDTGPGMPAKARENLFAAFRGAARSGGTGLGLSIAQELVKAHGGAIRLADKAGPGTRFVITLPDQPIQLTAYRARHDRRDDGGQEHGRAG